MSISILDTIRNFLDVIEDESTNVRHRPRQPFYRPVAITLADGTVVHGFTRDMSRDGVGLVHEVQIEPGLIKLEIQLRTGGIIDVEAELVWCRQEKVLYISGARFLEAFVR
jgi:hypothetical protein